MDNQNSLTVANAETAAVAIKNVKQNTHKPVKKKSTIVKLVLIGVALIIGIVIAFCPMKFGFTDYNPFISNISLGLDLKGGIYAVYEAQAAEGESGDFSSKMEGTRLNLQSMLSSKGYTEATVVLEGTDRIRVSVPNVDNPSEILKIIGEPAQVSFELENGDVVLTGSDVVRADAMYSSSNGGYVVSLELTAEGQEKFYQATSNNIGKKMSIRVTIGDQSTVISEPEINSAISGNAIIQGNFTAETSQQLADQIMSGTFDVVLELKQSDTISPTLGDNALKYGLIAGIVGFVLVIAFMCAVYRMLGFGASLSLLLYVIIYLFFLSVLPWVQLTLPGIAGILLSIGMAVDANIVIFERIKDEYRNGKSILAAYHAGFKKALFSILDSNVTTVIACILLLLLGTGSISGFALTLLVGVLLSLFTSLVVSRGIIQCFINLNSYNAKLYGLKRSTRYQDLDADSTDADIQKTMDEEQEAKRKAKEEKKRLKELEKSAKQARKTQEGGAEA